MPKYKKVLRQRIANASRMNAARWGHKSTNFTQGQKCKPTSEQSYCDTRTSDSQPVAPLIDISMPHPVDESNVLRNLTGKANENIESTRSIDNINKNIDEMNDYMVSFEEEVNTIEKIIRRRIIDGDLESRTLRTRPEVSPWTKYPVERPSKSYRKKGSYRKSRRSDDEKTQSETGETKPETRETEPETEEITLEPDETEEQEGQPPKKRSRPLGSRSVSHFDTYEHKSHGRSRIIRPEVQQDGPKKRGRPPGATNANRFPKSHLIVTRVYHFLEKEYEQLKVNCGDSDLTPFSNILQRTASATGVSTASISVLLEKERREKAKRKMRRDKERRMKEQANTLDVLEPILTTPQPPYQVVVKDVDKTAPHDLYYHNGILRDRSPHKQDGYLTEGTLTNIGPPIDEEHETRLAVDNILCTTDSLNTPSLSLSDTLIIKTELDDSEHAGTSVNTQETLFVLYTEDDT